MKILVTGGSGQVGSALGPLARAAGHEVAAPTRSTLDLAGPAEAITEFVHAARPDWVVNCAAMTDVEGCEMDRMQAMQLNCEAPRTLAEACQQQGIRLAHISTDYVFPGQKTTPYTENDPTGPINVYGESKLAGEQAVQDICNDAVIVRTSWVYGPHGKNFVKTIVARAARDDRPLQVVADQVGTPTSTHDLSLALLQLLQADAAGLFHFSNSGSCSWFEFARAILEEARASGITLKCDTVEPISSDQAASMFRLRAARPRYSVLDKSKLEAALPNVSIPHWRNALKAGVGPG